jgi:hypothetical protein
MKTLTAILTLLLSTGFVWAAGSENPQSNQDKSYVIDFNQSRLYLYDQEGNDLDSIKAKSIPPLNSSDIPEDIIKEADEQNGKVYLEITGENTEEELWSVVIDGKEVWIEKMAVKIAPGYKLDCSLASIVVGKEKKAELSGTIGLSSHCKKD